MEIIITDNDRIKVYDDHFALMELQKAKEKKELIPGLNTDGLPQ